MRSSLKSLPRFRKAMHRLNIVGHFTRRIDAKHLPDPDELECFFFRRLLFEAMENEIGFLGGGGGGGDVYYQNDIYCYFDRILVGHTRNTYAFPLIGR